VVGVHSPDVGQWYRSFWDGIPLDEHTTETRKYGEATVHTVAEAANGRVQTTVLRLP